MTPLERFDAYLENLTRDRPRLFVAVQVWIAARLIGWGAFCIWVIYYAYREISAIEATLAEVVWQIAGLWPLLVAVAAIVGYAALSDWLERR